jgi:hypothetical protein
MITGHMITNNSSRANGFHSCVLWRGILWNDHIEERKGKEEGKRKKSDPMAIEDTIQENIPEMMSGSLNSCHKHK